MGRFFERETKKPFVARPGNFPYKERKAARKAPCAYCGRRADPTKGITVNGHHPIPLSWVGDSIRQHPVPLCRDPQSGGCHGFFDSLVEDTGVTYQEYVDETERLRSKDFQAERKRQSRLA